jgi:hypothetical protein
MDNRRADYRHPFALRERFEVELESVLHSQTVAGRLIDLSVGGMKVHLLDQQTPVPDSWITRAYVPELPGSPVLLGTIVYCRPGAEGGICGVRFLPLADSKANDARDKVIWRFLLDQQRRLVRQRRWDPEPTSLLRIYWPDV